MLKMYFLLLFLSALVSVGNTGPVKGAEGEICYTNDCISTASVILKNLNQNADPCHDFFEYACGGFAERFLPQSDTVYLDTIMGSLAMAQVKAILEEDDQPDEPDSFKKVKAFYHSCMISEDVGLQQIAGIVKDLGGLPAMQEDWKEEDYDWQIQSRTVNDLGLKDITFFILQSAGDEDGIPIVTLTEPKLISNLVSKVQSADSDQLLDRYGMQAKQYFAVFGKVPDHFDEDLKGVFDFYRNFAEVVDVREESDPWNYDSDEYDYNYNYDEDDSDNQADENTQDHTTEGEKTEDETTEGEKTEDETTEVPKTEMTLEELHQLIPRVDWVAYIESAIPIQVDMKTIIRITTFSFEKLKKLVEFVDSSSKRDVANYVGMRFGLLAMKWMGEEMADQIRRGPNSTHPERDAGRKAGRWHQCVEKTDNMFVHLLTAMYIKKHLPKQGKSDAERIFYGIRDQFKILVNTSDWLDDNTIADVESRVHRLIPYISHPDQLEDTEFLDKAFGKVKIDEDNYIANRLRMNKFFIDRATKRQRYETRANWPRIYSILNVNAFYYPGGHYLMMPTSQIRDMYYKPNRPEFLNYASLGYVIGHEFMHSNYEAITGRGYYESIKRIFQERIECIREQYRAHKVHGVRLESYKTTNEDVADNTGLWLTYKAHQAYLEEHGPEQRLPGIDLSQRQQFWVAYANSWCHTMKKADAKYHVQGVHSPVNVRINAVLSNIPEFGKDFSCPIGSRLNPTDRCYVWRPYSG